MYKWVVVFSFLSLILSAKPSFALDKKDAAKIGIGILIGTIIKNQNQKKAQKQRARHPRKKVNPRKKYRSTSSKKRRSTSKPRKPKVSVAQRTENREIQQALNQLGFNAGAVDGYVGPKTKTAVRAWQRDYGYAVTGTLTLHQKVALLQRVNEQRPQKVTPANQRLTAPAPMLAAASVSANSELNLPPLPDHVAQKNISGNDASIIKEALKLLGYDIGRSLGANRAKREVRRFQERNGLEPTGFLTQKQAGIVYQQAVQRGHRTQLLAIAKKASRKLTSTQEAQNKEIQAALNALGFSTGPENGIAGYETRRAIRAWQAKNNLEVSMHGHLSKTQIGMLLFMKDKPRSSVTSSKTSEPTTPNVLPVKTVAATQTVNTNTVTGDWYGKISCSVRRKVNEAEIEFQITKRSDNLYRIKLVLNSASSLSSGTVETLYIGERTPNKENSITFVVERRTRDGVGQSRPGDFQFQPSTGYAKFNNGSCSTLEAHKEMPHSPRLVSTAATPADDGTYWAAQSARDKCEAIITWTNRLHEEYPGRDFYRSSKRGDDWRKIKLFGDDDFVPVFGHPYDVLPFEVRSEITKFIDKKCYRDPFTKERMYTFRSAGDRVLDGNPKRQLTSDGYSSTVFAIRQIRRLRHEVRSLSQNISTVNTEERSFEKTAQQLNELKTEIEEKSHKLWPSEQQEFTLNVDNYLASLAKDEAQKILTAATLERDAEKGLKIVSAAPSKPESGFLAYLSLYEKQTFKERLESIKGRFSKRLVQPFIERASVASRDIQGVKVIDSLMKSEMPKISVLDEASRRKYTNMLRYERDERLEALIDSKLSMLQSFTPDMEGARASAIWMEDFSQMFDDFWENQYIKDAYNHFIEHRSKLLSDALTKFEEDLTNASETEGVQGILNNYLSWSGDEQLPVALEYQLIAELYK